MSPEEFMIAIEHAGLLDRWPEPGRKRPPKWLDARVAALIYGDAYGRARAMRIAARILPRRRNHGVTLADVMSRALGIGCKPCDLADAGKILAVHPARPVSANRASQILAKSTRKMGDAIQDNPDWSPRFPVRESWEGLADLVPVGMGRTIFPEHAGGVVDSPA